MLQNVRFGSQKIFIRAFQTSCIYKTRFIVRHTKPNIGIKQRAKLLAKTDETSLADFAADPGKFPFCINQITCSFCFEQSVFLEFDPESDFLDVHKSHRQHEGEMKKHEQKISSWIVYNKYFRQKSPNFLTWAEKEHIRHLHEQDPEQWSPERLCESFPADLHIIKKILKANWVPRTLERVKKHDEAVKKNWELLRSSKGDDLNPALRVHLMKFLNRTIDTSTLPKCEPKKSTKGFLTKNNEFINMITTSKKYQNTKEQVAKEIEIKSMDSTKNHINFVNPRKNLVKGNREALYDLQITLNRPDNYGETNQNYSELKTNESTDVEIISIEEFRPKKDLMHFKDSHLLKINDDPIKQNIKISKKIWKRGATYKKGDCFYDDDGEFLYRVPGMTSQA